MSKPVTVKDLVKIDTEDIKTLDKAVDTLLELEDAIKAHEKSPKQPITNEMLVKLMWDVDYGKLRNEEKKN